MLIFISFELFCIVLITEFDRCHEFLERKKSTSVDKVMAVIEASEASKRKMVASKYDNQRNLQNGNNDCKLRSLSMEGFQTEFINLKSPSSNRQVIGESS